MSSAFLNSVFGENQNSVRVFDSCQAVSNGKRRSALGELFKGLLNEIFTFVVKCARCLVENEYGRIFKEHARDGDSLLLTAGELNPTLTDVGVVAFGES